MSLRLLQGMFSGALPPALLTFARTRLQLAPISPVLSTSRPDYLPLEDITKLLTTKGYVQFVTPMKLKMKFTSSAIVRVR